MQFDTSDTPTIKRRFAAIIYEALLLFGVMFIATLCALLLFKLFSGKISTLTVQIALQCWLFLVLGVYFCWPWCHGGQTLPMKTWSIRLLTVDGHSVRFKRAVARYFLAWLWLLPGLAIAWALDAKAWTAVCLILANVAAWALAAYVHPSRQFLHDRIAGTKLIQIGKTQ